MNNELAEIYSKQQGGCKAEITFIYTDGETSFIINSENGINLMSTPVIDKEVRDRIKNKLSEEEARFIGLIN